jgi:hypothetical protein
MRLLSILLLFVYSNNLVAQNLNIESATKFWELVDIVKKDNSISDSLWREYRNVKANSLWFGMAIQLDKNYEPFYKNAIEIVFKPSNKFKRDSILAITKNSPRNIQNTFIIGLYENYFLKETAIREFYKKVSGTAYLDTIYKIASKMLPKKYVKPTEKLRTLNIYIHCIENGANATKHGIIFSMAGLYNFENINFGTMGAHELHHLLRTSKLKNTIQNNHKFAVDIMESCLNEGSADMLNLLPVIDKPDFASLRDMTLNSSEDKIRTIDKCFTEQYIDTSKIQTSEEVSKLFNYLGGHNPGYFMAQTIMKNGYANEFTEIVDNPFAFFLLYQKSSKKDKSKPPTFSKTTIKFIKNLEKMYYIKE